MRTLPPAAMSFPSALLPSSAETGPDGNGNGNGKKRTRVYIATQPPYVVALFNPLTSICLKSFKKLTFLFTLDELERFKVRNSCLV